MTAQIDRRSFLRRGIVSAGAGAVLPTIAMVQPASAQVAPGQPGESPYGPLAAEPDENGLLLPAGFTSRVIATAGEPIGDSSYEWHAFPDGAATFDDGEGGWYYVCNSEVFDFLAPDAGGASAIRFGPDGTIVDAYRILEGSNSNCAGGPTPWGTWLSCEENFGEIGRVFECDPKGENEAVVLEALGRWAHEAVAVDPEDERLYLTQDHPEGKLYRFTPDAYPDLTVGVLEACIVGADNSVTWGEVTDPSGATAPTRTQVADATIFPGNEGIWYHAGWIYFTSKGDHSVHAIDVRNQTYQLIWKGDPDGLGIEGAVLSHVDNITVDAGTGDLIVAEDGGNLELIIITPEGAMAPLMRIPGPEHEPSEITGPVFNPTRDRLYFSSQRGPTAKSLGQIVPGADPELFACGITYEITGPFRGRIETPTPPPTSEAPPETTEAPADEDSTTTIPSPVETLQSAAAANDGTSSDDDDSSPLVPVAIGVVAVAAVAGGALALRRRRSGEPHA